MFKEAKNTHKIWHKFSDFLISNYGENFHSKLHGYEVQKNIETFISKNAQK